MAALGNLAVGLAGLLLAAAEPVASRPNVVVILCDDLGYGDLACYGHPHIKTPNLDQLASEGIRFTSCYSAAPVCSSSRAGLLSGQVPNRVGVYDWIPAGHAMHLPRSAVTVAQLLAQAGYATAHVGKWHCNGQFNLPTQPQPNDHGFGHWFSTQNNAAPRHANPVNFVRNGEPVGKLEGYSCQLVADEAVRWLDAQPKQQPFFLFVCFHEPHEPVESPPELVEKYRSVATSPDQAQYFANVENMDRATGTLLTALKQRGLEQNTLVYFSSDNGPETLNRYRGAQRSHGNPGPLRGMKLRIYDGGIRVPGIVRWPHRVRPGQELDTPVSSVDLLPTLSRLAGATVPADLRQDGTDITPVLTGEPFTRPQPLFWHYYRALSKPKVALRDGDWKLVAHWDGPNLGEGVPGPAGRGVNQASQQIIKTAKLAAYELYNLREDIGESNDRAADEPEVLARLQAKALALYSEIQQACPVWDTE